jgi:imidazoleglycerol-phosphate dehydratase
MRRAAIERKTQETAIRAVLNIDGRGQYKVSTGIRFFDHMLELFARHGGFDLELKAQGDLDVDQHHTVEDVGIVLGEAFDKALGSKRGILRAGYFVMPMDETLGLASVDFGGRAASVVDTRVRQRLVGDLQAELVYDFFEAFARERAPMSMRGCYMGARTITRLNPCSRPSRGRCGQRAGGTGGWPACCPAQRGCCDRDR